MLHALCVGDKIGLALSLLGVSIVLLKKQRTRAEKHGGEMTGEVGRGFNNR